MTEKLDEFNQYLLVAGFKNAKIDDVHNFFAALRKETGNVCIQFFDAQMTAGYEHLKFAALNALNVFRSNANISNSLAVETLLYASARRQIKEAMRLVGLKPSTRRIAVLILAETPHQASSTLRTAFELLGGERDDSIVELTDEKIENIKRLFGISKRELEAKTEHKRGEKHALMDLVIEHMALLTVQR